VAVFSGISGLKALNYVNFRRTIAAIEIFWSKQMPEGVGYSPNSVQTRSNPASRVEPRTNVDTSTAVQTSADSFKDRVDIEVGARQQAPVNPNRSTYEQIGQTQIRAEARVTEQRAVEQLQQRQALSTQRDNPVSRASLESRAAERTQTQPAATQRSERTAERPTSDALAVRVQQQSFISAEKSGY
jgi:hypothetical protein